MINFCKNIKISCFKKINIAFIIKCLILCFLFFTACSPQYENKNENNAAEEIYNSLNEEEKNLLRHFFDELLLRAPAAYVLWGTKPLADYGICLFSEEKIKRLIF